MAVQQIILHFNSCPDILCRDGIAGSTLVTSTTEIGQRWRKRATGRTIRISVDAIFYIVKGNIQYEIDIYGQRYRYKYESSLEGSEPNLECAATPVP